ncbi:MAG: hypothetical protein HY901_25975, partial [Deltaproteobacteria bacterium]|nr:hypothetical protein [Deltaproteobacteria bacterium]
STGVWDLAGPLANQRTAGDAVADLLIEQLVSLTGVPSVLQDQAEEALDAAIRSQVRALVDENVPAELAPGGRLYEELAASLAKVNVESRIELEPGMLPKSMKGTETFASFAYQHRGATYRLDAQALAEAGAPIVAEWSGKEVDGQSLEVDPHGVALRFGALVQKIVDQAMDAAGQSELKAQMLSAVSCEQIVRRISENGLGLTITLSEWSYTLGDDQLKSACDEALPMLEERVLGLIALDCPVEVGGVVSWTEAPSALQSEAGFGGFVAVAPKPLAPKLTVSFTALRQ